MGWKIDRHLPDGGKTPQHRVSAREVAHLRPRTNLIGAVARVRYTWRRRCIAFDEQGFFRVSTPLITASDTEGAGEMFRVSTLDSENLPRNDQGKVGISTKTSSVKSLFLTVSGQLNSETYACALSKIYTFGPTFRAETPTPAATGRILDAGAGGGVC